MSEMFVFFKRPPTYGDQGHLSMSKMYGFLKNFREGKGHAKTSFCFSGRVLFVRSALFLLVWSGFFCPDVGLADLLNMIGGQLAGHQQ